MASKQEIDKVIEATDIVALVSKYVKLEKNGKNYKGLCPFHSEDTPSFLVSPEKKIAHCFGCGGGGNPIKFLMQIENIDFNTALSRLAKEAGIELSNYHEDKSKPSLDKYYRIMSTAVSFYQKYIENTKDGVGASEYLVKRGLSLDLINTFKIGLSPKMGDTIYQILKESNYLELDMTDLGLVEKGATGYFDMFHDRIMFPIFNENNEPVGFSARAYLDNVKGQPKYINTRETILFKKGEILYNLNLAKGEILKKKRFILHEGQMDVIASYKAGLREAICTMGTALTMNQAQILKKYANHAIICYDADGAGINASKKAINIFRSLGMQIHLVLLPDKMDPDEYVNKLGSEEYVKYFEEHMVDYTDYLFTVALKDKNLSDLNVAEAVKLEIFELLNSLHSATEIEGYLKRLAEALAASFKAISDDFERYARNHTAMVIPEAPYSSGIDTGYYTPDGVFIPESGYQQDPILIDDKQIRGWNNPCELRLFRYARASRREAFIINNEIQDKMEALGEKTQRLWLCLIDNFYAYYEKFDEGIFIRMLKDRDLLEFYFDVIEQLKTDKNPYNEEDKRKCILKLDEVKCDILSGKCKSRLASSTDDSEKLKLVLDIYKNKRKKNELIKARRK